MKFFSKENAIFVALSLFIFLYILLRAIFVPAYHDEINTFFLFIQTGEFQPFYSTIDQNNHVLNSLFSHLLFLGLGNSLLVLRLANVLSSLIYLFYVWKISTTITHKKVAISWQLTMLSSLYFISFFSISRGYGLSMAFLLSSFYFLLKIYSTPSTRNLLTGLFLSSLALWAYLGLMIVIIILGALFMTLYMFNIYKTKKYSKLIYAIPGSIILYLLPLVYAIMFSFYIKQHFNLYGSYGSGFFESVFLSVISEFSGENKGYIGLLLVAVIFFGIIVIGIYNLKKQWNRPSNLFQILLWGTLIGLIVLHYAIGLDYPTSRMALYLFILVMVPFYLVINESDLYIARFPGFLVAIALVIQFALTFNLRYVPCWKEYTMPESIYKQVVSESKKYNLSPTISSNSLLGRQFIYYNFKYGGILNPPQMSEQASKISDYIIMDQSSMNLSTKLYDTLLKIDDPTVLLFKRKEFYKWDTIESFSNKRIESQNEYLNIISDQKTNLYNEYPFCYEIEFNAQSESFPFRCYITCDIWDSANKSISTATTELQCIHSDVRKKTFFHLKQFIENVPQDATQVKFYFYNPHKSKVVFSDIKVVFFRGEKKYSTIE